MNLTEPTFEEVMNNFFQHLEESDINNLKSWIESKSLNENVKKHFQKSFQDFQTDITSLKQLNYEEKVFRRIYAYSWELILLCASLEVTDFKVKDFSFTHNSKEKDLLIEFNSIKYHIEVTSKDDISRSQTEKEQLVKDTTEMAKELSFKNIADNSNFDYDVSKKFDIADTNKVLFIYQMKSSFFNLEEYIQSINEAVKKFNLNYIIFNNLSSTIGRFVKEYPKAEVKAWHNFATNDLFLNKLLESIILTLIKLKTSKEADHNDI